MNAFREWLKATQPHSSTFELFGYNVDKYDALGTIVAVVIAVVIVFWIVAGLIDLRK